MPERLPNLTVFHQKVGAIAVMIADKKVCILVANGFAENQISELQRGLTKAKITFKIVAPEQGLVNGWQGAGWGHYFTVDSQIGATLGSDYDGLILIGGERAKAKLEQNPHTRRLVNHFLEAAKPVSAIGEGISLFALSPKAAGLTVVAQDENLAMLHAAQIETVTADINKDGMVLTASANALEAWVAATIEQLNDYQPEAVEQAA